MFFFPDAPWKILLNTVLKLRINTARLTHLLQCLSGVSRKCSFGFNFQILYILQNIFNAIHYIIGTYKHSGKTEKEVSTLLIGEENFSQLLVRRKHNWLK